MSNGNYSKDSLLNEKKIKDILEDLQDYINQTKNNNQMLNLINEHFESNKTIKNENFNITEFTQIIDEKNQEIIYLSEKIKTLTEYISKNDTPFKIFKNEISTNEKTIHNLKSEITGLNEILSRKQKQIEFLNRENNILKSNFELNMDNIKSLRKEIEILKSIIDEKNRIIKSLENKN
ncbi:hypothetical protein [uncultured Methanobrevibacter sp.]|uniref:hypothetical protein n=1 Tax=uncultured Methanobrevibacter sp. TaxID=253161 RepID=UPI0025EBD5F6|nr:hypothetical protein [uncultured Methanobrevibacter sp.]